MQYIALLRIPLKLLEAILYLNIESTATALIAEVPQRVLMWVQFPSLFQEFNLTFLTIQEEALNNWHVC